MSSNINSISTTPIKCPVVSCNFLNSVRTPHHRSEMTAQIKFIEFKSMRVSVSYITSSCVHTVRGSFRNYCIPCSLVCTGCVENTQIVLESLSFRLPLVIIGWVRTSVVFLAEVLTQLMAPPCSGVKHSYGRNDDEHVCHAADVLQ